MQLQVDRDTYWHSGLLAAAIACSFFQIVCLFRFLLIVATVSSLR